MGKDINGKELGPGISQRKSDGRYMIRYKTACEYAHTLPEARTKLADMVQKVDQNVYLDNQITLNRYFKEFQKNRAMTKAARGSTAKSEATMFKNHIGPALGNKRVNKITVMNVKEFRNELMNKTGHTGKPLQPSTINKIMYCLEKILNAAVRDEIILQNPVCKVEKLKDKRKVKSRDTNHRALSEEEQRLFIQYAKGSWYYNALMFLLATGMRQGEARALKYSDIDYKNGVIHVRATMSYDENNKPVINDPKTRTSARDIPLNQTILDIIKRQKMQNEALEKANKVRKMDDYLFRSTRNLPVWDLRRLNEAINWIETNIRADGYEFPHISCHSLRATFTTRAIEAGMSPQTLKEVLGHANYQMTMDLYYHNSGEVRKQEMEKINKAFEIAI